MFDTLLSKNSQLDDQGVGLAYALLKWFLLFWPFPA